jgi:hypothetical protein
VGAGTKDFPDHANVVRVVVGRLHDPTTVFPPSSTAEAAILPRAPTSSASSSRPVGYLPQAAPHEQLQRAAPTAATAKAVPPLQPSMGTDATTAAQKQQQQQHHHQGPGGGGTAAWSSGGWEERHLCELEANLDDMTPETASFALERLLAEPGCLDVWYTPAVMKKGRPGLTLHLLCEPAVAPELLRRMFLETPTLGVRAHTVARLALERDFVVVPTRYGDVRAKVGRMDGVVVNVKPEYEDCKGAAMALGLPLRAVLDEAARVARGHVAGAGAGGEGEGEESSEAEEGVVGEDGGGKEEEGETMA